MNPGDLSGQHHVYTAYPFTFFDRASAQGYSGYLNFNRSTSADGRQIIISASSPALANRDYRCMTYELDARKHAPASDPLSLYDPDCGCWYRGVTLDSAGGAGIYVPPPTLWFDGFRPAGSTKLKTCHRSRYLRGKLRVAGVGCKRARKLVFRYFGSTPPGQHSGPVSVAEFSCDGSFSHHKFHISCTSQGGAALRFNGVL